MGHSDEFRRFLSTSVDDLRSSLDCNYKAYTSENMEFLSGLRDACPESRKSMRQVIETKIRKLQKLAPSSSAALAPAGQGRAEAKRRREITLTDLEVMPAERALVPADRFALVNQYHEMARLSMAQSCAYMILAGVELLALKKDSKHGQWEKQFAEPGSKSANVGAFAMPLRSAQRYMGFAEAAKKHIAALRDLCSDHTPLSLMPPDRREALVAAVRKTGDGKTYGDLASEWGLAKKPRGSGAKGGNNGGGSGSSEDTEEEAAIDLWRPVIEGYFRERKEGSWAHLPDKGEISWESLDALRLDLNQLFKEAKRR